MQIRLAEHSHHAVHQGELGGGVLQLFGAARSIVEHLGRAQWRVLQLQETFLRLVEALLSIEDGGLLIAVEGHRVQLVSLCGFLHCLVQ